MVLCKSRVFTAFFALLACWFSSCDEPETEIYLAKFPDDKIPVSLTFDDGAPSTFTTIVPALNRFGYKASFFIVPSLVADADWELWKDLAISGHEIGNHSLSHVDLTTLSPEEQRTQINEAYAILSERIGKAPSSFAAPGHRSTAFIDQLVFEHHEFLRTSTISKFDGWVSATRADAVVNRLKDAYRNRRWHLIVAHGVGDGWGTVKEKMMVDVLQFIDAHKDQFAVRTFENVARYVRVRDNSRLSWNSSEKHFQIQLSSTMPLKNLCPLTVVIKNCPFPTDAAIKTSNGIELDMYRQGNVVYLQILPGTVINISWLP